MNEASHLSLDPWVLPKPSDGAPRPLVTLSELTPGYYIDTTVRVAFFRVAEKIDQMGKKLIMTGTLEDSTFRVPFISHKLSIPFENNSVMRFHSAYVHEFKDRSVLLVLTEYSRAEPREADIRDYIWHPNIASIKRPVRSLVLEGMVSNIYSSSGLVKRCNGCKRLVYDSCVNHCKEGWSWDVRISGRIYDGTGSMRIILSRYLASQILGRSVGEILLLANAPSSSHIEGFDLLNFKLKLPERFEAIEAVVKNASSLRAKDRLLVTEGLNLAYFLSREDVIEEVTELSPKLLDPKDHYDSRILRKFIEKALEIKLREITGRPVLHGLHLLSEPVALYRCEKAKLYLGFSTTVSLRDDTVFVDASPRAFVREGVWDYVRWRRERGATANAIERTILGSRSMVVLAPFGHLGRVEELVFKKAGESRVSDSDKRTLVDFWKDIYGIDVDKEEIPLLKVRLMNVEQLFTYPPSTVYFDNGSLFVPTSTQNYVENRKSSLRERVRAVVARALDDLSIGKHDLERIDSSDSVDVRRMILDDIHKKLLGRRVKAKGEIVSGNFAEDSLCFFPSSIIEVRLC